MQEVIHESTIQKKLEDNQTKRNNDESAEIARKYYFDNKEICDESYKFYNKYNEDPSKYLGETVFMTVEEAKEKFQNSVLLALTANSIEYGVLIRYFADKYNIQWRTFNIDDNYYHILEVENKTIVHIHTYHTGEEYTRRAINFASKVFQIDYILLLGICYGIKPKKQHIGDVVVSNDIHGYRIDFRDNAEGTTDFVPNVEFIEKPYDRFNRRIHGIMNNYHPANSFLGQWRDTYHIFWKHGKLLSANSLMSSKAVKDCIVNYIGMAALGGEMEACGIFKTYIFEEEGFKKWLVIKSICDWGEKKNSLFPDDDKMEENVKNSFQSLAMLNTCTAFETMLIHGAFDERGNDCE